MPIPLTAAVFVMQLVSLLGIVAIGRIVVWLASILKDIDFQLMYKDYILLRPRLAKFRTTISKRQLAGCLFALSLDIGFLPAIVTSFINERGDANFYTNIKTTPSGSTFGMYPYRKLTTSLFKGLYDANGNPANSIGPMLEGYISIAKEQSTENPTGLWYNVLPSMYDPQETRQELANFMLETQDVDNTGMFNIKGIGYPTFRPLLNDATSSTLDQCDPFQQQSNILNLTSIEGHQVTAARTMSRICYPIIDQSLWYAAGNSSTEFTQSIIRTPFLPQTAKASFFVGIYSNTPYTGIASTMIKKSAHITVVLGKDPSNLNCNSSTFHEPMLFEQDVNSVVCQIIGMAGQNPALPILQATRRMRENGKLINSVYTYIRKEDGSYGITVDLTSLSAYTVTNLLYSIPDKDNLNVVVEHRVDRDSFATTDYNQLLEDMNPFPFETADMIKHLTVFCAYIYEGAYWYFFKEMTATVHYSLQISLGWIIAMAVLGGVFIVVITGAHLMTPKVYRTDLRSLVIHSLVNTERQQQHEICSEGINLNRSKAAPSKDVLVQAVRLDETPALSMDGALVVCLESRTRESNE